MTHHKAEILGFAIAHDAELDGVGQLQMTLPGERHVASCNEQIARGTACHLLQPGGELDAGVHVFEIVAPLGDEVADARLSHTSGAHGFAQLHGTIGHAIDSAQDEADERHGHDDFEQRERGLRSDCWANTHRFPCCVSCAACARH